MPWRYALFVTPIDTRWRVSVLDDAATRPEPIREVDDRDDAIRIAHELAVEFSELGDDVSIMAMR